MQNALLYNILSFCLSLIKDLNIELNLCKQKYQYTKLKGNCISPKVDNNLPNIFCLFSIRHLEKCCFNSSPYTCFWKTNDFLLLCIKYEGSSMKSGFNDSVLKLYFH